MAAFNSSVAHFKCAVCFLVGLSSHLQKHSQRHRSIRPVQLFFSTLKNPKALLFAAGVFPPETWHSPSNFVLIFAIFSLVLLPSVLFWMSFGRVILGGQLQQIKTALLYKGSAMLLLLCMLPVVARFF